MPKNKEIAVSDNPSELAENILSLWSKIAQDAVQKRGAFVCALSGGKTPIDLYKRLAKDLNKELWSKTHIFLTDERFVPAGDPNSNFKMIQENLLRSIQIPVENLHPVLKDLGSPAVNAEAYAKEMKISFSCPAGDFPCFDLMLLGLGEDGHTASLFPGTQALEDHKNWVTYTLEPKFSYQRISLTFPVINHARNIIFLVCGEKKSGILKEILVDQKEFPAARVKPLNGTIIYMIDKAAASKLS